MSLISVLGVLLVIGVVLSLINTYIPMQITIKYIDAKHHLEYLERRRGKRRDLVAAAGLRSPKFS